MEEKLGGFLKEYEIVKEAYTFFDHVKEDFSIAKEYLVPYVFDAEIRARVVMALFIIQMIIIRHLLN